MLTAKNDSVARTAKNHLIETSLTMRSHSHKLSQDKPTTRTIDDAGYLHIPRSKRKRELLKQTGSIAIAPAKALPPSALYRLD